MPILIIAICTLPALLANIKSDETKQVAVIDATGCYGSLLHDTDEFHFFQPANADEHSAYAYYKEQQSGDGALYAIVTIPATVDSVPTLTIYSPKNVPEGLSNTLSLQLEPALRKARIKSYGIEGLADIMAACNVSLDVQNIKWDKSGEETMSAAVLAQLIGLVLSLLTYMFVLSYGSMIMNGVIEEKTNRIVEVIVSSCRPMELMLGKIIGVALVGLTQMAVWSLLVGIGFSLLGINQVSSSMMLQATGTYDAMATADQGGMAEIVQMVLGVNWGLLFGAFILYFIGGYLLYAALFAAFGSAVDQPSDASQFTMPVIMILAFALYAGIYSVNNPDGPLAWWCSIIPFTSPIVMMVRLPFDVPTWELLLSLVLLFVTALGITYLAGRIYRTGILMYGKKISLKELLRWVRG